MKTPEQLKGYLRKLSKEKNISVQELLQVFMFERLIERISLTKYKNNLVIKGGLLVASLIGIDERTTMDMDATIVSYPVNEESIEKLIKDIISVQISDGFEFNFLRIVPIRENDEYCNFTISLNAIYETILIPLKIDITTGDIITPKKIKYEYYLSFEDRNVSIYTYPIETVFAEKLETILSRNITNTRARDFYDIYHLYNTKWENVNVLTLKNAIIATANHRDSLEEVYESKDIMRDVASSKIVSSSWERYQNENDYARHIELEDILKVIENILDLFNF